MSSTPFPANSAPGHPQRPTTTQTADARGMKCPFPVLYAHKALAKMETGDHLELLFTDPTGKRDIPSFCQDQGHKVLSLSENAGDFCIVIECVKTG